MSDHEDMRAGGEGGVAASATDTIYGVDVPRRDSWWVGDGALHHGTRPVALRGLNWFGLETADHSLHGLWSGRSIDSFLEQIVELGFNALRVPLAPESLREGQRSAGWGRFGGVETGIQQLEYLLLAAGSRGLYVLLDVHTCSIRLAHMASGPEACEGYERGDWLDDLEALARLAARHPHVVGIDLFNEPYGLSWDEWMDAVAEGGARVLQTNPRILVFVEGIAAESEAGGHNPFWGENLYLAGEAPPKLPASRLVYSPHVYGPSVSAQTYFDDPNYPDNMPAIWDAHFGDLAAAGHALCIGEFGGRYEGADRVWQDAFVDYLLERRIQHFFYWCWNPNSGDTGGLLLDDWRTVDAGKMALLQRLFSGGARAS